jgi:hypothetical protein
VPARDELHGDEHRDDLEDVRDPAGGERQGRDAQEDDEDEGEALLAEGVGEVAERARPLLAEPPLEQVADGPLS